jgi:CheY-like chemotaxis protein/predicted CopG family antitoxin
MNMNSATIFTKTAKGVIELKDGGRSMSELMARALRRIDGKTSVGKLFDGLQGQEARSFSEALKELEAQKLIRVFLHRGEETAAMAAEHKEESAPPQTYHVEELSAEEGVRAWAEARRGARELTQNGFYATGQAHANAPHSQQLSVLVVEDDEAIATLIRMYLSRHGFQVAVIGDGLEALKALDEGVLPDLVLLDVNLPHVNGFDILAFMRSQERSRNLPAIMVTAQASEADVLRGLKESADGYIFKPFEWKALHACIDRVLGIVRN